MTTSADTCLEAPSEERPPEEIQQESQEDLHEGLCDKPVRYRYEEFWSRVYASAIVAGVTALLVVMLRVWPF
jgi:hypothetical protein